jgi:hypothetical protein
MTQTFTPAYTWTEALAHSHTKTVTAAVYHRGALQAELDVVLDGTVDISRRDAVRRTCRITLVAETVDLVAARAGDLLAPPAELRLRRGIVMPDGTVEDAPLGVFGISVHEITDTGEDLRIAVTGYDRARRVRRNRWTDLYVIPAGTNYADAIADLVEDRAPGVTMSFTPTTATTPQIILGAEADNDPWDDAQKMATAIGCELFFDAEGVLVLQPEPDPDIGDPDWVYAEGADATILSVARSIDDEPGYNGVIVIGEGTGLDVPLRGEAWDDEPRSPSYYLGDWGRVPRFYRSQLFNSQAQVDEAAAALLRRELGALERVSFSAIANPRLDVSQVVSVVRGRARVDARYITETVRIPLGEDIMEATTRARRV